MNKLPIFTFATVLLSGCFHVALEPPAQRDRYDQRIAAYQRLRPAAAGQDVTIYANQYGASVSTSSTLFLADGTKVVHADDLLPVLDPATPAAAVAERSAAARRSKIKWAVAGGIVMLVGSAIVIAANDSEDGPGVGFAVGLAGMSVGALAATIGPLYFARVEENERQGAFALYDASLRQSLQICVDGMWLVDCASRNAPAASR